MKKGLFLTLVVFIIFGCAVPVKVPPVERIAASKETPVMEFIGFKNLEKSNFMFATFALELQNRNIAIDKQSYYLGNYSLQDLGLYNSKMRFTTFIERVKSSYGHKNILVNKKDGCNITYKGIFTIYVYDTVEKSIVWTKTITINENDDYVGRYYHENTNYAAIDLHYQNIVYNSLFEEYIKAYDFISKQLSTK